MQPAEGIHFIHHAICAEARALAAAEPTTPEALRALGARVAMFAEVSDLHTRGEEIALFPELEGRAPHVAAAYVLDHEDERACFAEIAGLIAEATEALPAARPALIAHLRRRTAVLAEHVLLHVRKENELVVPLIMSLFSPAEQAAFVGKMMATFPPPAMARILPWLVERLEPADRVRYVEMIRTAMPPERFAGAIELLRKGLPAPVWSALAPAIRAPV